MIEKFQGEEGKRRAVDVLLEQRIVKGNGELAEKLFETGSLLEVIPGDSFIDQGAEDNDIYFILSGNSEVLVNGRKVANREAGTYVGEMALIDHAAKRSATVRATEKSVLLRLKEEDFTPIANKYPNMWRSFASELGGRLRQRGTKIKAPNEYPEIFVGSSSEQLDIAHTIQSGFSHEDVNTVVWTNGVFGASKTPLESLASQLDRSDFAVLVLGDDDIVNFRGAEQSAPRDNVIFELGLFIGRLGKDRVFMVSKAGADLKIPSDLIGVSILEYKDLGDNLDAKLGAVCTHLKKIVKELGTL